MVHWLVWSGLAVVILAICFAFVREQRGGETPAPSNPGLARAGKLPVISQLTDFTLTNQLGQPVRLAKFADKVWFADIVFTRCSGPCPTMTKRMAALQAHFADNPNMAFATLTTDPNFDMPEVMKRFAERHGAQDENWDFLTGEKSEIVRLAVDEMKLIAREKPAGEQATPEDLFIHSSYFVVIDVKGRLRGVIESLDEGWKEKAIALATQLLNE
jgi:protein SCO1/2